MLKHEKQILSSRPSGRWSAYALLVVFFLYEASANVARVFRVPGFSDNLLFTEALLYFFSVVFLLRSRKAFTFSFLCTLAVLSLGFIVGCIQWGFAIKPALYAARLFCMIVAIYAVGRAFWAVWGVDWVNVAKYFTSLYAIVLILGFVQYLAFPNSVLLWMRLRSLGVVFNGDPHRQRFFSVFLDPNFYSVIIVFAVVLQLALYFRSKNTKWLILMAAFIVSIALSKSRSGFSTVALVLFLYLFPLFILASYRNATVSKRAWRIGMVLILGLVAVVAFFPGVFGPVFKRIVSSGQGDLSTMHRIDSFGVGLDLIRDNPFGIGYNYYNTVYPADLSALDSSLLMLILTFGLPLTAVLVLILAGYALRFWRRLAVSRVEGIRAVSGLIAIYVLVCVLWASNFNNLLFYQFWLVPVGSFMAYLFYASGGKTNMSEERNDKVENEMGIIDLLRILMRAKWMIVAVTGIVAVVSIGFAVVSAKLPPERSFMPNVYTSTATVLISDPVAQDRSLASILSENSLRSIAGILGVTAMSGSSYGSLAEYLVCSNEYLGSVAKEFDAAARYGVSAAAVSSTYAEIRKRLSAKYDVENGVLRIQYTDTDPSVAQRVVNYTVDWLKGQFTTLGLDRNAQQRARLEKDIQTTKDDIRRLQADVRKAASSSDATFLELELDAKKQVYTNFMTEYATLQIAMDRDGSVFTVLDRATLPDAKSGPSRGKTVLIATMLAFFAAIVAAFVREGVRRYARPRETDPSRS